MILAIMQPYFFPYIGYFQLLKCVDTFVIYDDVNYIKKGWVNRNNFLAKDRAELITLEILGASQNKLIKDIKVGANRHKIIRNIKYKYSRAPEFKNVFPLIENILNSKEENLSVFLSRSLNGICEYLGFSPKWLISSELDKNPNLRGQDKILDICEILGATHYINPAGGMMLYDKERFAERGVSLSFLKTKNISYKQFNDSYIPNLSIVDLVMFNSIPNCRKLLNHYELI